MPSSPRHRSSCVKRRFRCVRSSRPPSPKRIQMGTVEPYRVPKTTGEGAFGGVVSAPARMNTMESYRILKKIGEGAFGAVSEAHHIPTGELVAIKSSRDGGDTEAVLREAAMLAACAGNPAVVRLLEVVRGSDSETDSSLHLVMEYVGPSLSTAISSRRRRGKRFSEPETRRNMAQLLAGAATMHAHGIVHRDLKPANVLIAKDGRLRICDLGLAKPAAEPPLDNDFDGTLGYIAPEVLLREDCGKPVDVWALGCTMAELVLGEKLFAEGDLCQQLIDILQLLGITDEVSSVPLGIKVPSSKLREKVPAEQLSEAGFDVLRGLLEYHPMDRLTAAAALKMPWFTAKDED